eukprot:1157616-Pelagomonas_calceolata.AAC.4
MLLSDELSPVSTRLLFLQALVCRSQNVLQVQGRGACGPEGQCGAPLGGWRAAGVCRWCLPAHSWGGAWLCLCGARRASFLDPTQQDRLGCMLRKEGAVICAASKEPWHERLPSALAFHDPICHLFFLHFSCLPMYCELESPMIN